MWSSRRAQPGGVRRGHGADAWAPGGRDTWGLRPAGPACATGVEGPRRRLSPNGLPQVTPRADGCLSVSCAGELTPLQGPPHLETSACHSVSWPHGVLSSGHADFPLPASLSALTRPLPQFPNCSGGAWASQTGVLTGGSHHPEPRPTRRLLEASEESPRTGSFLTDLRLDSPSEDSCALGQPLDPWPVTCGF